MNGTPTSTRRRAIKQPRPKDYRRNGRAPLAVPSHLEGFHLRTGHQVQSLGQDLLMIFRCIARD